MSNQLVKANAKLVDDVALKINTFVEGGELVLPSSYIASNALKSALLMLQEIKDNNKKPVLESCSKESIANALLDMAVQGLNPLKSQCYFIPYGGKLQLQRSYFGDIVAAKRVDARIGDIVAMCVYEGDDFQFEIINGQRVITKHGQSLGNIDNNKIVGAYAVVNDIEGNAIHTEIMSFTEIKQAWNMGFNGPGLDKLNPKSTHAKFTQEMSKKTVIKRAVKLLMKASDDSSLVSDAFHRTDENEYTQTKAIETPEQAYEEVQAEAEEVVDVVVEDETPITTNDEGPGF